MKKRIFGINESDYVNEWFGLLKNNVTVLLFKKGRKMSVKAYTSYSESNVNRIDLPFNLRGGKITTVGPADHVLYTFCLFLLFPLLLLQDLIIFMTPTFFTTLIVPFLKIFGKKVYIVSIDPQLALYNTYQKRKSPVIGLYWRFSRFVELMAIRLADAVFVVSDYQMQDYKKYNKNIFLTTNGADLEAIEKIKPKRIFKDFTIAYLGSFDPWRGVDILVKAFKIVEKKNKAKLLLIGGGSDYEKIKDLAKGSKNIQFMGYTEHGKAISYMKGSDLIVIPFRDDPILRGTLSMKPFESIACGKPIIITNTGQHADIVKNFGAGLVVDANEEKIAEAIIRLMKNKNEYRSIKRAIKKGKNEVDFRRTRDIFYKKISLLKDDG